MSYLDVIAMFVFIIVTWAACAVAAGTALWFVGVIGYGVSKVWEKFKPQAREAAPHPGGRKHGRRVAAATVKTFVPVGIRRRVYPLI